MIYRTSIGLDVHARSISAAAFVPETGEVVERSFGYDAEAVAKWAGGPPQPARAVYESGPTGFDLKRSPDSLGLPCAVGAVSKMLKPSGDRVKTGKRDAAFLARMLADGNVVEYFCPAPGQEAARDPARARADAREDLMAARHRLSKMPLRKGIVYEGKSAWTKAHRERLRPIGLPLATERLVMSEYLQQVVAREERRDRLDAAIAELAASPEWAPVAARLSALRGISTATAFSVAAEIGDFSRLPTAPSFMSHLGLVPSEDSSGGSVSRGAITPTGNAHVRTLLAEAAWHHARRWSPLLPTEVAARRGIGPEAARVAAEANRRLHSKSERLRGRGASPAKANVAVARELAGFVWALAVCEG